MHFKKRFTDMRNMFVCTQAFFVNFLEVSVFINEYSMRFVQCLVCCCCFLGGGLWLFCLRFSFFFFCAQEVKVYVCVKLYETLKFCAVLLVNKGLY